jgi:tripartite-type tricarboxylate transporter receptor subunit TctC
MKVVVTCVSLALALVSPDAASIAAEETSGQSLRIIVPLSAGSAFDILARAMGNAFKERTQQPVIVENRPGGNMGIAANACKSAPPDGSTICLLTQNAITLNPLLYSKLSYNPYTISIRSRWSPCNSRCWRWSHRWGSRAWPSW